MEIKLNNQLSITRAIFCTIGLFLSQTNVIAQSGTNPANPQAGADPAAASEYSQISREYHLKAAFLRYVAQYVEFPAASMKEGMINLCVFGQVPYFDGLNSINGKVVNNRSIVVSKIANLKEGPGNCQIVFVAKTESDKIPDLIKNYAGLPILPFGDMDNFAQQGGAMNFYVANNRLAIMTNLQAIEKSKLVISPQMLKLVTLVPH